MFRVHQLEPNLSIASQRTLALRQLPDPFNLSLRQMLRIERYADFAVGLRAAGFAYLKLVRRSSI